MASRANGEFERFFAATSPRLVAVLSTALGDADLAREASQEAFARAFQRWPRVREMSKPDGWVYVTAMRVALRSRRTENRDNLNAIAIDGRVRDHGDEIARRVMVAELLATLTTRQRQAVVLRFAGDMTIDDVALAMGCAAGTVKATLHQALLKLRVEIGPDDAH